MGQETKGPERLKEIIIDPDDSIMEGLNQDEETDTEYVKQLEEGVARMNAKWAKEKEEDEKRIAEARKTILGRIGLKLGIKRKDRAA